MKRASTATVPNFRASDSYLTCVKQFALRPLKTRQEYNAAMTILGRMASNDDLDSGEQDYLAALSKFVGDYETATFHAKLAKLKPLEALRYLMEENQMTTTDLGHILGSRGLASEVLHGKRGLSKMLIARLSARFNVNPSLFLEIL